MPIQPDRQGIELGFGFFHPRRLALAGRLVCDRAFDIARLMARVYTRKAA